MSEAIITNNTPETSFHSEATPALNPCVPGMRKGTYYTNINFIIIIIWLFFILGGIIMAVVGITESQIVLIIFGAVFDLLVSIFMGCFPLLTSVVVDPLDGTLQVRKYSLLICCWKKSEINLKEIRKIYSIDNKKVKYEENGVRYKAFDLIVEFINGEKKTVLSGEIDKDYNRKNMLQFLYKYFPQIVGVGSIELPMYPGAYIPQNNVYMGQQTPQIPPPGQPMPYPPQQPMVYPVQQPIVQPGPVQPPMVYQGQQPIVQPYPVQPPMGYPGQQNIVLTQSDLNNQLIDKPKDNEAPPAL